MWLNRIAQKGKQQKRNLDSATKCTLDGVDGRTEQEQKRIEEDYEVTQYYCRLCIAIEGGVEAPLQFIFQVSYYFL